MFGWAKYVGAAGQSIGMHSFGASAPLRELSKKFGFTPEDVVAAAREQLLQQAAVKKYPTAAATPKEVIA